MHDDQVSSGRVHRSALGRGHPLPDQGMDDRVQLRARVSIAEDERAEPVPVQGAVRAEHADAEGFGDARQPGRARGDHLPGRHVRVNEYGPVSGQPPGYLTLAGPDTSGQPDPQHRTLRPSPKRRSSSLLGQAPGGTRTWSHWPPDG